LISKIWRLLANYRLHILLWLAYFLYEYSFIAIVYPIKDTALDYVTHYTLIIALFYLHAHKLLPLALRNKYTVGWKIPAVIIIELGVYVVGSFWLDTVLVVLHSIVLARPLVFDAHFVFANFFRESYFIGFSTGYYYLITFLKQRRMTEESEKQRLNEIILRQKAEQELTRAHNAFLKAQINPHFLFNTLDFIYHNIMEVSPFAAEAIITLADMMRYAIDSDKMGDYVVLGDEIDQVMNLQYLNQIRKNVEVNFHLSYPNVARELHFIPLVLLTLTENIFKHGNLTGNYSASLKMSIRDEQLIIESENFSIRTFSTQTQNSNGTGLRNIAKRLHYAYGNAASINYGADEHGKFKLMISVPVQLLHEIALS
jgi:two-component system LytT family sensor kinase